MHWSDFNLAWILLASCAGAACSRTQDSGPRILNHEAYVWQRDWNSAVRQAISEHAPAFTGITVLNAEIAWSGKHPQPVRVPLDYSLLKEVDRPVSLALRIGPFPGPFQATGEPIESIGQLAESLVRQAQDHGLAVAELQIDFDCAASKLSGYQIWVETLRRRVARTPLSITALPSWLRQSAFKELASTAGSYVLQVHSLERPRHISSPFTLCDTNAARRAVEQAGRIGVPFRVALPTYGYSVAFGSQGKYLGLAAEGPARSWPADAQLREVNADPEQLAGLVRHWSAKSPRALQGIIWYRLPVATDTLNWPWATLEPVMAGKGPRPELRVEVSKPEAGLVELSLVNHGTRRSQLRPVSVRWAETRLVAADALQGFQVVELAGSALGFYPTAETSRALLAPGKKRTVGWLRFSKEQEVQVEFLESNGRER
jgi:hypothetical protein